MSISCVSGLAWVAIFLVISLEGWTDVMYFIQDVHSFYNFVYFVVLIIVIQLQIGSESLRVSSDRDIFHDQSLPGRHRQPVL